MPKKVFYKSVHEILEYDDLRILQHAGFDVFSRGAFSEMSSAANTFRQHACAFNSEEDIVAAASGGITTDASRRERLSKDFAERFDVFVINQDYQFVLDNIDHMRNRPVIYRSIGQSTIGGEASLKAVANEIVTCRYYENEVNTDFLRTDHVIYFGKIFSDYPKWNGGKAITTFYNWIDARNPVPNGPQYRSIVEDVDHRQFGLDGEHGLVPGSEQNLAYQGARAYLYLHTLPASYTLNFMEAMVCGVPILAASYDMTAAAGYPEWWPDRYAIPHFLSDGAGLLFGSVDEARQIVRDLDRRDLLGMSKIAREKAADLFGHEVIARKWRSLINSLV